MSDNRWRVAVLDDANAGAGLFKGSNCGFAVPDYWTYGVFEPKECCELPGCGFVARTCPENGVVHTYYAPGSEDEANTYETGDRVIYAALTFMLPRDGATGGQYGLVCPMPGPWRCWIDRNDKGEPVAHLDGITNGQWRQNEIALEEIGSSNASDGGDWITAQLVLRPKSVLLQVEGRSICEQEHDPYEGSFAVTFGCGQGDAAREVRTEYSAASVQDIPYAFDGGSGADGPEDIRSTDEALVYMVSPATAHEPRHSEGDLIELKDGSLLLMWSNYYAGKGWDDSPASICAKVSRDGGQSWGEKHVAIKDMNESNVMSVSLARANNGDILMVYADQLPGTNAKSMVARRSFDEGKSWSDAFPIYPDNGNRHLANNAGLRVLLSGRIILATREYIDGIRWPYCLYSDDDGVSWQAGAHVPDPGLSDLEKRTQNVNEPSIDQLGDGRLLMTMRSMAGGQFFAYSSDEGSTWSTPYLSPLRGACSPAALRRIPGTNDILVIWTYGLSERSPLVSAISHDNGRTWEHLKLVEQSRYHGYCYTSITFVGDRAFLTYMHYPQSKAVERFQVEPGYTDLRLTALPISWFYRDVAT